jgi:hypothetical protein
MPRKIPLVRSRLGYRPGVSSGAESGEARGARLHFAWIWTYRVEILVFAAVETLIATALHDRGPSDTWEIATAGGVPLAGFYSPLPTLVSRFWQICFGDGMSSYVAFMVTVFALALCATGLTARELFGRSRITRLALYLTILSPYLVWSVRFARDVEVDVLGVSLMMLAAARVYARGGRFDWMWLAVSGALATSLRESNLVVFVALWGFLWLRGSLQLRPAVLCGLLFLSGMGPLLSWNYVQTGTLTLSTRLGVNLYLGNHPQYLLGHPNYDIDVFLPMVPEVEALDPVARNRAYISRSLAFIRADPIAALHRSALKALWWFGPTRVPGTDAVARLAPSANGVAVERWGSPIKEIPYILHRCVVLIALLLYWRRSQFSLGRAALLLLPGLALLPIIMLTFPDTRFRLATDPAVFIVAAAGISGWFEDWQSKRARVSSEQPAGRDPDVDV